MIKKGTKIYYRPCFGLFDPKMVKVTGIIKSQYKRCKYGDEVESVSITDKDYCVFLLDDGHWCYGEQIDRVCPR